MADKLKWLYLLGLGYLLIEKQRPCCQHRGEPAKDCAIYTNAVYPITFKYPNNWTKNPNYQNRYEGPEGFFEVAEIQALGRNIDQVAQQEVDTPIEPYGKTPQIQAFMLDGEPTRLIIPSDDQNKVFDREVGLIIKNKKPVEENGDTYNYTIIWSDRMTMQRIISSFQFTN